MLNYLLKRLALMIPTLIGISIVIFLVVQLAPGDPVEMMSRDEQGNIQTTVQQDTNLQELRKSMGLDGPYHERYFRWISHMARLDFGKSMSKHVPVVDLIRERIGVTILLNVISTLLVFMISVPVGLIAARNRERGGWRQTVFDTGSGLVLLALYSLPSIFVGTVLLTYMAEGGRVDRWAFESAPHLSWLVMPIGSLTSEGSERLTLWAYFVDVARHLALPVITLTIGGFAFMSKQARTSLLENLRQDYVRTARAKGLRERVVVYVHALRNSLLPLLTLMTGILPAIIGGSVVVEKIFNLPGMGLLMWEAITQRDYFIVQAISLIGAVLTLTAILITDILYVIADPRIRYE